MPKEFIYRKDTNTYIHQLEASFYLQLKEDKEEISFSNLKKLFTGSLPDSLGMRYIKQNFPNKFFGFPRQTISPDGEIGEIISERTNAIIDVTFKYDYKTTFEDQKPVYSRNKKGKIKKVDGIRGKIEISKKNIRRQFYKNGFWIDGIHYVLFMRSSSKSRQSQCLFIDERVLLPVRLWSRMGLVFEENELCDIASLMAYESLTLSGIIGIINIQAEEILLINDHISVFTEKASVTKYDKHLGKLVVSERSVHQKSDIWDGQSLLDESKFTGDYKGKGCVLLRNKFFKSCAFNTKIQKYFAGNNIEYVVDMFGVKHDAKKIRLIITPNSLKALKFAYKLETHTKEAMYEHWKNNIEYDFGVCKTEKPSKNGEYNRLSYQMINSLPLSSKGIGKLAEPSFDRIRKINNDFEYFKEYLGVKDKIDLTADLLYNLCVVNPDIQHTAIYKDKRRDIADNLKKDMKKGRLLAFGDYAIMVSNPIEMLKSAIGIEWEKSIHEPYEIYSQRYRNGCEITGFRNPHVASGNVCVFTNVWKREIEDYLNLTGNIVVVNSYKNDVMSRLQGADTDSDSILLVYDNDDTLLNAAEMCRGMATPLNRIRPEENQKLYNIEEIADTDYIIGENLIGKIINLSQLFNSYYWDYRSKGASPEQLQLIYDQVSKLSSMSQLEIDKAKKFFKLNVESELKKIANTVFHEEELKRLKTNKNKFLVQKTTIKRNLSKQELFQKQQELLQGMLSDNIAKLSEEERKCITDILKANQEICRQKCEDIDHIKDELRLLDSKAPEYKSFKSKLKRREIHKTRLEKIIELLSLDSDGELVKQSEMWIKLELDKISKWLEKHSALSENFEDVNSSLDGAYRDVDAFVSENKIIKMSPAQVKKHFISMEEGESLEEWEQLVENGEVAKKDYDEFVNELFSVRKIKQTKPMFFKDNSKDKNCNFIDFETPMDYLIKLISKTPLRANGLKPYNIRDLINYSPIDDANARKKAIKVEGIAEEVYDAQDSARINCEIDDEDYDYEKYQLYRKKKEEILCSGIEKVKNIPLDERTMKLLLLRSYSDKKAKNKKVQPYRRTIINLLYKAYPSLFIECFRKSE